MKVKNLITKRIVEINEDIFNDLVITKRINCVWATFELLEEESIVEVEADLQEVIELPKVKKEYNFDELSKLTKDKLIDFIENEINVNLSEEDKELTKKELINKFLK